MLVPAEIQQKQRQTGNRLNPRQTSGQKNEQPSRRITVQRAALGEIEHRPQKHGLQSQNLPHQVAFVPHGSPQSQQNLTRSDSQNHKNIVFHFVFSSVAVSVAKPIKPDSKTVPITAAHKP